MAFLNPMYKVLIIIILFFFQSSFVYCQETAKIDTVNIYKNKTGVRYKVYKHIWFPYSGSYSWFPNKTNSQDSIVMIYSSSNSYYFKVYNRKNKLCFEGRTNPAYRNLQGKIKYYYKSGELKKIEYREESEIGIIDTINSCIDIGDEYSSPKIWKYYRKKGTLKKQIEFIFKVYSCSPVLFAHSGIKTTRFKFNEKVRSVKRRNRHSNSLFFTFLGEV